MDPNDSENVSPIEMESFRGSGPLKAKIDYYNILGVDEAASRSMIYFAYKKKSLEISHHINDERTHSSNTPLPSQNELDKAYSFLFNPYVRWLYDDGLVDQAEVFVDGFAQFTKWNPLHRSFLNGVRYVSLYLLASAMFFLLLGLRLDGRRRILWNSIPVLLYCAEFLCIQRLFFYRDTEEPFFHFFGTHILGSTDDEAHLKANENKPADKVTQNDESKEDSNDGMESLDCEAPRIPSLIESDRKNAQLLVKTYRESFEWLACWASTACVALLLAIQLNAYKLLVEVYNAHSAIPIPSSLYPSPIDSSLSNGSSSLIAETLQLSDFSQLLENQTIVSHYFYDFIWTSIVQFMNSTFLEPDIFGSDRDSSGRVLIDDINIKNDLDTNIFTDMAIHRFHTLFIAVFVLCGLMFIYNISECLLCKNQADRERLMERQEEGSCCEKICFMYRTLVCSVFPSGGLFLLTFVLRGIVLNRMTLDALFRISYLLVFSSVVWFHSYYFFITFHARFSIISPVYVPFKIMYRRVSLAAYLSLIVCIFFALQMLQMNLLDPKQAYYLLPFLLPLKNRSYAVIFSPVYAWCFFWSFFNLRWSWIARKQSWD